MQSRCHPTAAAAGFQVAWQLHGLGAGSRGPTCGSKGLKGGRKNSRFRAWPAAGQDFLDVADASPKSRLRYGFIAQPDSQHPKRIRVLCYRSISRRGVAHRTSARRQALAIRVESSARRTTHHCARSSVGRILPPAFRPPVGCQLRVGISTREAHLVLRDRPIAETLQQSGAG